MRAAHTSGPIAVVVSGLLIDNQGHHLAMSETTREYLDTCWELVDELLNAVRFVLIGSEVLALTFKPQYVEVDLIAIPLVLLLALSASAFPSRCSSCSKGLRIVSR